MTHHDGYIEGWSHLTPQCHSPVKSSSTMEKSHPLIVWPVLVGQIMIALCSDQLIILIDTVSYLSHWANDTNWKYGQVFAIGKEWSVNMSVSDADWLWSIPTVYFFFLGISLWEKWGIYHSGEPLKIWLRGRKGRKKRVVVMVVTRSQYMQTTISSCGTYWGNHITHFC